MQAADPFGPSDALVFRRFILEVRQSRAVQDGALAEDTAADFLKLSIASTRQLLRGTFKMKRADGALFRFFPAYVDSLAPNAFAGIRDGVHLTGVNVGLAASFHEFSMFCFAQPRIFVDFGQASAEQGYEPFDDYAPGFWFTNVGAALKANAFVDRAINLLPRDPNRQVAATLLTALMLRFAWFHELYHCLHGHVAFVSQHTSALCLDEAPSAEVSAIAEQTRHALEFDADQSAFWMQIQFQRQESENIEGLRRLPLRQRLRLAIFASYATTWIMAENARRDGSAPRQNDHPSPEDRLWNMIRIAAGNIIPLGPDENAAHEAVITDMECVAGQLKSFPGGAALTAQTSDPALQGRLDEFAGVVAALRTELDALAYR